MKIHRLAELNTDRRERAFTRCILSGVRREIDGPMFQFLMLSKWCDPPAWKVGWRAAWLADGTRRQIAYSVKVGREHVAFWYEGDRFFCQKMLWRGRARVA